MTEKIDKKDFGYVKIAKLSWVMNLLSHFNL
jgi:hypothetical protein